MQRATLLVFVVCCLLVDVITAMGFPRSAHRRTRAGSVCEDRGVDVGTPLLLTPLINAGRLQEARTAAAATLDGVDLGYSGFFSVPSASAKNTNNFFLWYQPCDGCDPSKGGRRLVGGGRGSKRSPPPLLQWMQGGPGAPSSYGSTNEIGPFFIDGKCKIQKNQYTWCGPFASCIFIDNPVQTGFSYQVNASGLYDPDHIEYTQTSYENALQIVQVLRQFFVLFPEVAPSPFWITGESYGGNYVPNLAKAILDTGADINLAGVSVGDPVMNQVHQWPTYADTLYGMGLVNVAQREKIRSIMAEGVQAMLHQSCKAGFDFWNSVWNDNGEMPQPFYYQQFSGSSTTYESLLVNDPTSFAWSGDWLSTSQVKAAMHYGGSPAFQFNEGGPIYDTMVQSGDFCQNSSDIYAYLLTEAKIPVQIYSSTNDPLLGPPCSEAGVLAVMKTAGTTDLFNNATRALWSDSEGLNGYAQCFYTKDNVRFCYTVVRGAGHMAPQFQPRSCQDMTYRFINNIPFDGPASPNQPSGPQCAGSPPFTGTAECDCHLT